jgi:hypothetical protein
LVRHTSSFFLLTSKLTMIEFVASGSSRALSRTIEEFAADQRLVSAIVVPWESDATNLTMSVTAVTGDGWAIEHTNLGTIRLTDLGNDRTRFAAEADDQNHPDQPKAAALFERFVQQLQGRFQPAS